MADDLIQVPFIGGPDESADPRALPLGRVISAYNQVYDADGVYTTRFGYTGLTANASPNTCPATVQRLATFNNELLEVDGQNLWGYDGNAQNWTKKDVVPAMGVTHAPLNNATSSYESWDMAVGSGYRVAAWNDQSFIGLHVAIYSTKTGALVLNTVLNNPGAEAATALFHVRVGIIGTVAIVTIGGAAGIYAWNIQLNPLGAWSAGSTISSVNYPAPPGTNAIYCAAFLSDRFIIAYEQIVHSGTYTSYIDCLSFTSNLAVITTSATQIGTFNGSTTYTNWFGVICMAACGTSGEAFWIACATADNHAQGGSSKTTFEMAFNTTTLAALSSNSPPVVALDIGNYVVTRLTISRLSATSVNVSANGPRAFTIGPTGAGLGAGTAFQQMGINAKVSGVQPLYNLFAASQPVYIPSLGTHLMYMRRAYFSAAPDTAYTAGQLVQGTYFLVDLQTGSPWSVTDGAGPFPRLLKILAPRIVSMGQDTQASQQNNSPSIVPGATAGTYETVMPIARTVGVLGLDLFTIDFSSKFRWTPATLGRELYLSDYFYDGGVRLVETGFTWKPQIKQVGSTSGALTWEYVATYLRIDTAGNVEESAPSDPLQVSAASPSFAISVEEMTLSQKQRWSDSIVSGTTIGQSSAIYLVLYRTQALQNGDTLHHRVAMLPLPVGNLNSPVASYSGSINDSASDVAISVNTVLYTDAGELPRNCPESFTFICDHKNRIWGIGADQRSVWFSSTYVDGLLPSWNEQNILTVDDAGEPLIGLGSLYDKLLFFTMNKVYVTFGDGPSVAGTGSDLQEPARVPSPVGCIDPRSIVQTPMGVFFQSSRGLELFDQAMNLKQIGLPVIKTTAAYPICTSAIYCEATSTVRFTMVQNEDVPADGLGVIVVYDVRRERWAVHQLTAGGQRTSLAGAPIQAACVHPVYGYVEGHNDSAGGSYALFSRENTLADATPWLDYGTYFVSLFVQMAWCEPGGLQGWATIRRVRAMCAYYSAHGLTATFRYDYVDGTTEVHALNSNVVAGFVNGSQEMVKYFNAITQCSALQVSLQTVAPIAPQVLGSGQGASFVGVAFETRQRKGGWRRGGASAQS